MRRTRHHATPGRRRHHILSRPRTPSGKLWAPHRCEGTKRQAK